MTRKEPTVKKKASLKKSTPRKKVARATPPTKKAKTAARPKTAAKKKTAGKTRAVRLARTPTATTSPATIFQFKITLMGAQPPIWRRIQVPDGTLDELHQHIQTAMGWTNSHLHEFAIAGRRYAAPTPADDFDFGDTKAEDSTRTRIGEVVPSGRGEFRFRYVYDFGDSWEHAVEYEGSPPPQPGQAYPLCLEGARACPPEDVGGVWGFADFLLALADPRHEQHREFMEWAGRFDPAEFDATAATRSMQAGLPTWSF